MIIYKGLRDMREDHDKTQANIAKEIGITTQQYQLYESGKREIPLHLAVILAQYYNVSLDYLAGLIDTPRPLK